MDNKHKKQLRRTFSGIGGLLFIISGLVYGNFEFPLFNHWNPLYNPYYFILFGVLAFLVRTFVKEHKEIWDSIGWFQRSGLTRMHDVEPQSVGPTHIRYTDKFGRVKAVKHHHPFAIPSSDGYDNVYLTPSTGVESLDPAHLVEKYGAKLLLTDEQKNLLLSIKVPEIESLDPSALIVNETESDDPDTLMQEYGFHMSQAGRGNDKKFSLKENWFVILGAVVIGMTALTFLYMAIGVDFRGVIGH